MKKHVLIAVPAETREKIRLIAEKTNAKKNQIVADAVDDFLKKIFVGITYKHGYKKPVIDLPAMAKLNKQGEVK